ncbi:hypothetical protein CBR_g34750 [Chara braunii]|uniref:Uncharacterized protein n=1 Tax=Chara braunii TaxID=69332 RepID=A0A388LJG4_CHABU|nr:hypothetical protein CBR_g34750 [Chara braunii]|eukprot:GBG82375.1 hypothetical protein CBR_g34750 [Chara braunii]
MKPAQRSATSSSRSSWRSPLPLGVMIALLLLLLALLSSLSSAAAAMHASDLGDYPGVAGSHDGHQAELAAESDATHHQQGPGYGGPSDGASPNDRTADLSARRSLRCHCKWWKECCRPL